MKNNSTRKIEEYELIFQFNQKILRKKFLCKIIVAREQVGLE